MAWKDIIGQNRAKSILQKAILENRIAHSYCLWGNEGIGKDALALEFAKVVNCHSPVVNGETIEACGSCSSCHQMASMIHPNLIFIFSLPTPKASDSKGESSYTKLSDDQIDTVREQLELKAKDYYHQISIAGANQIKITAIRDIKKNLTLTQQLNGRRCVIVSRADELTTEAANAFLKTLEEPHDSVTIILTTSRVDTILPTIISRCQQIHCDNLTDDELTDWLIANRNLDYHEARMVAAFAQGSYTRALEFINEEKKEFVQSAISTLRTSLKKKNWRAELLSKIEELTSAKDKRLIEDLLSILLFWFRDAVSIIATQTTDNIINIREKDSLLKFSSNFYGKDFSKIIEAIEKVSFQIRRNVNPQLALISMFYKFRQTLL